MRTVKIYELHRMKCTIRPVAEFNSAGKARKTFGAMKNASGCTLMLYRGKEFLASK